MSSRAVIYARKSTLDARNPGKSIADQIRECEAEAARRGLDVVRVIDDQGKSASRHARKGTTRTGYGELVDLVHDRGVDVVVMAEQSRGTRRLSELGALMEASADAGVRWVVGGRDVDPREPADIVLTAVQGGMDASESERLSKRARRGALGSALAGRPAPKMAYGYTRTYDPVTRALQSVDIVAVEADVLRGSAARILSGESLYRVVNDLNDAGLPGPSDAIAARQGRQPRGTGWSARTLSRLLASPVYAGLRIHHPGQPDERVIDGVWPALWSRQQHRRLVRVLTDPRRGRSAPDRVVDGAVVHWLSGLATCGECGSLLRVRVNRGRYRSYACTRVGCFAVARTADPLEAFVRDVVVGLAARPAMRDAVAAARREDASTAAAWDRVDDVRARLDEVRAAIVAGSMSVAFASPVVADLEHELELARKRAEAVVLPGMPDVDLSTLGETFDGLEPGRKRAIAAAFVDVVVNRAPKSRTFDPAYVVVTPKG